MCVEQTLHEMLCYKIWIQKEDSANMCPFFDDLFLLSPLDCFFFFNIVFFFKGNNVKLTPYVIPLPLLFLKVVCYLSE